VVAVLVAVAAQLLARRHPAPYLPPAVQYGVPALLVLSAGVIGLLAVRTFARARTTVNPVQIATASTLVTDGVFAWSRNPMYLALTSLVLAAAIAAPNPWALAAPVGFAAFLDRFQIRPEERMMRAKFGAAYDAYASRVRRWI
jgi:protein-S-isoprenylcysteine O-methyltransferase Ste14